MSVELLVGLRIVKAEAVQLMYQCVSVKRNVIINCKLGQITMIRRGWSSSSTVTLDKSVDNWVNVEEKNKVRGFEEPCFIRRIFN